MLRRLAFWAGWLSVPLWFGAGWVWGARGVLGGLIALQLLVLCYSAGKLAEIAFDEIWGG